MLTLDTSEAGAATFNNKVIAIKYLNNLGYKPGICETEEGARQSINDLIKVGKWPCYFFKSDTTGEKDFEEFYTKNEDLDLDRFHEIGVIKNDPIFDENLLSF